MCLYQRVQFIEIGLHFLNQRNTGHRIVRHIAQITVACPKAIDTEPTEKNERQHHQQRYQLQSTSNIHNRTLQMETI